MLVARLIEEIIDNFKKQQQLYASIAALSCAQLDLLSENWLSKQDELNDLLKNRQLINKEIDALNTHNKSLQEQVIGQLKLPGFVLSQMGGTLDESQYKCLSEVIAELGILLAKINATDEQNQILIKQKAGPARIKTSTSRKQAQNAYHQAGQQGKKN